MSKQLCFFADVNCYSDFLDESNGIHLYYLKGADFEEKGQCIQIIAEILKEGILSDDEESAEEYGIPVTAWSAFEYLNLPAATLNGVAYPAGYYETLCVTLKRL